MLFYFLFFSEEMGRTYSERAYHYNLIPFHEIMRFVKYRHVLGFGSCRMCVCGPQDAKELLEHREVIRVATKYPKIAKDYFYNKKHQTVEIIKMNGSIELAPIVGLSEVIVDIVETGSTLKENGLTVLEEVCPLSARMIVNPVSMRMENDRIRDLIGRIRNLLEGETV